MVNDGKPLRKRVRTHADNVGHLTHYASNGQALLICGLCLQNPDPDEELNQAITVWNGTALCEWHIFPGRPDGE